MPRQTGEQILQDKYNTTRRAAAFYNNQMLNHLNSDMESFISEQEMVFISTSDSRGHCDSSFRAGYPGFVRVIDKTTLAYPEFRGNGVMASMGNITENPHIGLMFIDFFESSVGLHVNGRAYICENKELETLQLSEEAINDIQKQNGKKVERWVVIEVEEAFIHCSKHIPKLKKGDKQIENQENNIKKVDGDYFNVKQNKRNSSVRS
ncbi:pyridoxamine 5'-phosphate oxidase family protein [Halalkalibacter kiskunsagensis]|uniref:Pyridoxamine 5'-phosphate oxidase family protein n=1 Tax=Halalkalibacter kiskunsagensis TaxID=1548599 RepID=A0ABV6KGE9_9BACI